MPISPTRTTDIVGTDIKLQAHPSGIQITWNPQTGQGDIRFEFLEFLSVDGNVLNKDFGRHGHVRRRFGQVATVKPGYPGLVDPVTGQDLTNVSMHGVYLLLLDAFDRAFEQDNTP